MIPEIGEVWTNINTKTRVLIIQRPGKLVLYWTKDKVYGSLHVDDFIYTHDRDKTVEEVLS